MKSFYLCITSYVPRGGIVVLCALLVALGSRDLQAQVGNDSPDGVVGFFSGTVTTGCSYSSYTGNITRSVTDIAINGGVSKYPLALVRTYNSRDGVNVTFGQNGWRHSYQWGIASSTPSSDPNVWPGSYTVTFPDGRVEKLHAGLPGSAYTLGLRERFQSIDPNTMLAYLILPDGGKVEFRATQVSDSEDCCVIDPGQPCCIEDTCGECQVYYYTYQAQAIIDPYGQRTAFTYNAAGRISGVTEPGGRYLQFYYRSDDPQVIDHVTGSDGRTVQYNYVSQAYSPGTFVYRELDDVVYYGQSQWTARYKYRAPNAQVGDNGTPLLWTADDPMYPGPMKRIAYDYKTGSNPDLTIAAYGQVLSERYWDGVAGHESTGAAVSTLTVGASGNSNIRTETRADGKTRTFTYLTGGYLSSRTDFMNHSASQAYDANMYVNSVTDENNHVTNFTCNAFTGKVTQIQYPASAATTPSPAPRGTVNYTYGNASCADANNRDPNNPYYVCTATDEAGHVTQFTRDTSHRVTRVDYPDGAYETFSYNSFGQVLSHRMRTGGTETFTYDGRGLKLAYRNPDNASGNPTARYQYDAYDRVSNITDVLGASLGEANHTTSFAYNLRGQLTTTTLARDPVDNVQHTITNAYNADGTLQSRTDQLGDVWSYTYDNYRRVRSLTTPGRGDGTGTHTISYFYDANGTGDDYQYTDSSVTFMVLPSGKTTKAAYDDNRRSTSVTVGFGSSDAAATASVHDNVGNVTQVTDPLVHSTLTAYDERNRPSSITEPGNLITTIKYDGAGREKIVTRPNGQTITYDTFDAGNRVTQQTVTQSPEPDAITKYTYYTTADGSNVPVGLLHTMQDPHLVGTNSSNSYSYIYDLMGRKAWNSYPDGTVEHLTYDSAGRLGSFRNRGGDTETFTYDGLNRVIQSAWDDNGVTPTVTYDYDVGSRQIDVNNANATVHRVYWDDNTLESETETPTGGVANTITYFYDPDGKREWLYVPGYTFQYQYTGRNQLENILDYSTNTQLAHYEYDVDGKLTLRSVNTNPATTSGYLYDAQDRLTWITHTFNGATRGFNYGYDNVGNRTYSRRLWGVQQSDVGDVFSYDLADQVSGVQLNVPTPQNAPPPDRSIIYDANGNRIWYSPYYPVQSYATNDLGQYSSRITYYTEGQQTTNAGYDLKGNMLDNFGAGSYTYDAQNRLTSAYKGGTTFTFLYDGLNRQVSRTGTGATTTYSVWDGWDLVEEYHMSGSTAIPDAKFLNGATGLVKNLISGNYYYQDGQGSTSHLTDGAGHLLEWYRYDLHGAPMFYDPNDNQITASAFGIRHLFTGQQWYRELGLYDLRNRFYSPDVGRFLQPDPIGFGGDATNLYRYCRNNPLKGSDPSGLQDDIPIHLWNGCGMGNGVVSKYLTFVPACEE